MTAMMGYDITDGVLDTKFNVLLEWFDERNRSKLFLINIIQFAKPMQKCVALRAMRILALKFVSKNEERGRNRRGAKWPVSIKKNEDFLGFAVEGVSVCNRR